MTSKSWNIFGKSSSRQRIAGKGGRADSSSKRISKITIFIFYLMVTSVAGAATFNIPSTAPETNSGGGAQSLIGAGGPSASITITKNPGTYCYKLEHCSATQCVHTCNFTGVKQVFISPANVAPVINCPGSTSVSEDNPSSAILCEVTDIDSDINASIFTYSSSSSNTHLLIASA